MKKGWEVKTLGEVCMLRSGTTLPPSIEKPEGELPYLKVADMNIEGNDIYVVTSSRFVNKSDVNENGIIPVGSTIFPKRGGAILTNKKRLTTIPICMDLNLMAVSPKQEITSEYLFYYFIGLDLRKINNGSSIPQINNYSIEPLQISYPSLPEQQRIVSVLDEAFASIAQAKSNAERNLVNARELFEAVLQSSFENAGEDWEERKLEDLFSIKHGFAFKGEFFTDKGKYVLLTPGNFYEEGGYRDRGEKQKYYVGDIPKDYLLKKGDILVAMTEQAAGLLGSPIIIPESNMFLHNQRLGLIIYKEENKIDTKFLFHLFNTKRMRSLIHQSASGVKVRHTSPSKILEISAFIPPLAEQRAIVGRLEALSAETGRLEEIYQQKVESLEELKKSFLQKAFEGEL
jgi:type I restriction enzyme S subunit